MKYTIYTDGAYSFAREKGGCAFVILNEQNNEVARFSKSYIHCTNNTIS